MSRATVRRVMLDHGLIKEPGGPRRMSWKLFLRSHWESVTACDFFTVEAWTKTGLARFFVFFAIDISTRRVQISGIERHPHEGWMVQQARNLTDADKGFLKGKRFLIHDRDALFTRAFRATLRAAGVRCIRTPKRSPNLNAYAERFVRSIKEECLDKMILMGEKHLRYVVEQYMEHCHLERPHQGLQNARIEHAGRRGAKLYPKVSPICWKTWSERLTWTCASAAVKPRDYC